MYKQYINKLWVLEGGLELYGHRPPPEPPYVGPLTTFEYFENNNECHLQNTVNAINIYIFAISMLFWFVHICRLHRVLLKPEIGS